MLSIRTRGKHGIYYIRGSVGLGKKKILVKEFSTGTSDPDAAAHLMAEHETKLRHQLMFGPAALVAQGTIAQAFDSYLTKAKPHVRPTSCASASSMASSATSACANPSRRGSIFAAPI